jgi:uncharacterized protein (TIGR02246 family)
MEAYAAAVFTKDADAFAALYAPEVRIFNLWAKWSHDGVEAWHAMAVDWFGSLGAERVVVGWDDARTSLTGEFAILQAFFTYKAVSAEGAELRAMSNRLTWVLTPTNGAWKIIHEHTSAPVDSATMKVILKR